MRCPSGINLQMINRNHAQQIRACERIKFDQALYILTMYEKKIRKSRRALPAVVDADAEMQDIICSWKNKWKMDLTKPILNCVTSVYPRVLVDPSRQDNDALANYYSLLARFLSRLRTEHEDETNFKLVLQAYDRQIEYMTADKYQASSKATVKGLLTMARDLANDQLEALQRSSDAIYNESLDVDTDRPEWGVERPLRWVREVAGRALVGEGMELENDIQPKSEKAESLIAFSSNVVRLMERIKESEHGSTLVTIQPRVEELTMLFHPLLVAIAANFKKENHEKEKDYNWAATKVEAIPLMDTPKSSFNCSRVVLINLDGYESEYNLELARNFKKHLLYISFPKEDALPPDAAPSDPSRIHSRRFFKKLMFRHSQALFESFAEGAVSEDYRALTRMERLMFNPQDYHCCAEKLYDGKADKGGEDFNQNIYVFPVRNTSLRESFPQVMEGREDIENHESYFIRFMIKDFLLNQIRQFNPTLIMLSYSGRLHIDDHHFVEILQELTKIANYKLLLFPNLTASLIPNGAFATCDKDEVQCDYDNCLVDPRIGGGWGEEGEEGEGGWTGLLDKMARFLKVSSGTYNLNRSFEEEPLVSKYKNQFILGYIDELMAVLGKEYTSIDKIRFRNKDLSILPKLFEENIRNIKKTFDHTVPRLYADIYEIIEYLLLDREQAANPRKEQLLSLYTVDAGRLRELLDRCADELARRGGAGSGVGGEEGRERVRRMREVFQGIKESHLFEISSEKFEEKANIYIKVAGEVKQFAAIGEETESLRGLFEVGFLTNPGKVALKLYESTRLLYQVDQRQRKSNRIPVLIMNNLTDPPADRSFQNYYAELDISNAHQAGDKKAFQQRKCLAVPLGVQGEDQEGRRTWVLSDWSFHQSQDYLMLFWPSRYDFLQAFLHKLLNRPYHPRILSQLFLVRKGQKQPFFRRVPLSEQLPARVGASCYQYEGKVFVFGGFYQREKNYLQLQHDIVTLDLREYDGSPQAKVLVQNVKGLLYARPAFEQRVSQGLKPNSFVRPRMEFQFFQREELMGEGVLEEEGKWVVMLGGYGQNFLRPYSLLTYYYYLLRFDRGSRALLSIEKRLIYNKAIPVNTREMTKNLGVIKTNRKTKTGTLQTKKLTEPDAYTLYRNCFRLQVNKEGEEEFNYKFKYMFSQDEYRSFKHEIKKIQEIKAEEFDSSSITVERDPKNNHRITLEKDSKKREVQLRMEIPAQRARKLEGCPKEVSLTHESIIHLDVWNSNISAIVRHDKYTQGRSVLLEYSTKALESFNFEQDSISHLAMSWAKEFDRDLSLHVLIICNKNTVAILHGEKLARVDGLKEYIVKRKKNDNVACEIREREQQLRRNEESPLVNTVFFRHRNKIMAIDFIAVAGSPQFYINCQEIQLTSANEQFRWTPAALDRLDPDSKYEFCIAENHFVRMEQLRFLEFYKGATDYFLVAQHNRRRYVCEVGRNGKLLLLQEEAAVKLETDNMERGSILVKTEDKYIDRDFL